MVFDIFTGRCHLLVSRLTGYREGPEDEWLDLQWHDGFFFSGCPWNGSRKRLRVDRSALKETAELV